MTFVNAVKTPLTQFIVESHHVDQRRDIMSGLTLDLIGLLDIHLNNGIVGPEYRSSTINQMALMLEQFQDVNDFKEFLDHEKAYKSNHFDVVPLPILEIAMGRVRSVIERLEAEICTR